MRSPLDRFMEAFRRRVEGAVRQIDRMEPGVENLTARIEGRVITLTGVARSREIAAMVIDRFRRAVAFDNILDAIRIAEPSTSDNGA